MAKIHFLSQQEGTRKPSDWQLVGKLWPHKTKADAFSGRFGVKVKDGKGGLTDIFNQIVIKPEDPIMIRQSNFQGEKAPKYLIYMLKDEAKTKKS